MKIFALILLFSVRFILDFVNIATKKEFSF